MSTSKRTAGASKHQAPESWQLSHRPDPDSDGWECLLYSDAYLNARYGQHAVGPFLFWATHAEPPPGAVAPRLALRIPHAHPILEWQEGGKQAGPSQQVLRRNSRWWLGMSVDDEVAALLSLALGVRLRSGGLVRRFVHGGDPAGVPELHNHHTPTLLHPTYQRVMLPQLRDAHAELDPGFALLRTIPTVADHSGRADEGGP